MRFECAPDYMNEIYCQHTIIGNIIALVCRPFRRLPVAATVAQHEWNMNELAIGELASTSNRYDGFSLYWMNSPQRHRNERFDVFRFASWIYVVDSLLTYQLIFVRSVSFMPPLRFILLHPTVAPLLYVWCDMSRPLGAYIRHVSHSPSATVVVVVCKLISPQMDPMCIL